MTLTERGNYFLAMVISIALHCLLLFLAIQQQVNSKQVHLQTYPVGLVEMASGSSNPEDLNNQGLNSLAIPAEKPGGSKPTASGNDQTKTKPNPNMIPATTSKKPSEDAINLPNRENKPLPNNPNINGSSGLGENTSGKGNNLSGAGKPVGFGSGEGMVTVLGPMPPYPKNAMNEGKEGEVAVRVLVKADGSLDNVNMIHSSGDLRLDKVTISAIQRSWKFKPVTKDYYIDITFTFNLKSGVTLKFINSESRP